MTYKEIQVPSDEILRIYTKSLSELETLVVSHNLKYEENLKKHAIHYAEQKAERADLAEILGYGYLLPVILGQWDFPSSPAVHSYISDCKSVIEAANLVSYITMTEQQFKEMQDHANGVIFSKLQAWYNAEPFLYDNLKYEREEVKKVLAEPKETPAMKEFKTEKEVHKDLLKINKWMVFSAVTVVLVILLHVWVNLS